MNGTILAIDIGTTEIISIVASKDLNGKVNILGVGKAKSEGVNKGNIIDITLAGTAIKESVETAISSCAVSNPKVIVSVSGINTKILRSVGNVNIPTGQITHNEIKRVLKTAKDNANVMPEYDVLHVLPIFFRVDEGANISNPLNMNGNRLEVSVNVIAAKRTSLTNIDNALKLAHLEVNTFVLAGYANSIAILEEDQKKLGTVIIDLGGSTTQAVVYKESTILYSDILPIGSENITNDISRMLHTPYSAANMIKKQYGTLLSMNTEDDTTAIKKVKLPILGNEKESKDVHLSSIQPIIHARIEETLVLIKERLYESSAIDSVGGGIILTGGMVYIRGIKELASAIFSDLPIKIATPKNIQNGYIDFNSPTLSTIVGLLLYELEERNNFELDCNENLKAKIVQVESKVITKTPKNSGDIHLNTTLEDDIQDISLDEHLKKDGIITKITKAFERWF
jgi:cell division protein FtsA